MKKEQYSESIERHFSHVDIAITPWQVEQFSILLDLLMTFNKEMDLTGIINPDEMIIKHFLDSVYPLKYTTLPKTLMDIGSGAGFPGIPLKIMSPETTIILAEPRHKRVDFHKIAIEKLKLKGISSYPHQVTKYTSIPVSGVITRAFENIIDTLKRINHFTLPQSKIIFMKGPNIQNEEGYEEIDSLGHFRHLNTHGYDIPGTELKRSLAIYKKTSHYRAQTFYIPRKNEKSQYNLITSDQNKTYKQLKKSSTGELIKKQGVVIVSGKKVIKDLVKNYPSLITSIIMPDNYTEDDSEILAFIQSPQRNQKKYVVRDSLFENIDYFNTKKILCEVQVPEIVDFNPEKISNGTKTMVIPFQDPANVGAVLRTAAAFGINSIIMTAESAHPMHPKSLRASSGAAMGMKYYKTGSVAMLSSEIIHSFNQIIALDPRGKDISEIEKDFKDKKVLIIPGIEGPGLPENLQQSAYSININENVESLNAATSVAILLYELSRN